MLQRDQCQEATISELNKRRGYIVITAKIDKSGRMLRDGGTVLGSARPSVEIGAAACAANAPPATHVVRVMRTAA